MISNVDCLMLSESRKDMARMKNLLGMAESLFLFVENYFQIISREESCVQKRKWYLKNNISSLPSQNSVAAILKD